MSAYVLHHTPSKPYAHLLQEMASRWCHWSVCLVLTIEVYEITNHIAITGTYFYCYNLILFLKSCFHLYGKKVFIELVRPYLDAYAKKSHVKGKLIIPFYSWSRHG